MLIQLVQEGIGEAQFILKKRCITSTELKRTQPQPSKTRAPHQHKTRYKEQEERQIDILSDLLIDYQNRIIYEL